MAFVANARPKQARQAGLIVKPPKTSRTRILVRWTRESGENPGHGRNLFSSSAAYESWLAKPESRIPKVAVFLKYCLPCREICVRWKSVIGRAVMAPREGWSNAFVWGKVLCTWIDKSEDLQTPKRRIGSMAIVSYPHTFRFRFGAKRYKTQRRWLRQSSFFW